MSFLAEQRRRPIPAPKNPLDRCTIINLFPKPIKEVKHTIQPGYFHVPAGSLENPGILVVGSSSWWREIDEESPLLEIPNSSIQVAESVTKDYANGLLACNMGDAMPALFFIPGEHTQKKILTDYKDVLVKYNGYQNNWYAALVKMADTLWARTNGNPLVISDDMRLAATELGMTAKEWMSDFQTLQMINCVACGSKRNPAYPICASCHNVVDKELAKKLGLDIK